MEKRAGEEFVVEVTSMRNPPSPEFGNEWGEARVTGGSVVYLGTSIIAPPPDDDGGYHRHLYRFSAEHPGTSVITIPRRGKAPYTVSVDVR